MENPPKWLQFAPKIALAVSIGKMDDIYKTIAYKLNDKGKTVDFVKMDCTLTNITKLVIQG